MRTVLYSVITLLRFTRLWYQVCGHRQFMGKLQFDGSVAFKNKTRTSWLSCTEAFPSKSQASYLGKGGRDLKFGSGVVFLWMVS